jgi:serine/threonine protein kinase
MKGYDLRVTNDHARRHHSTMSLKSHNVGSTDLGSDSSIEASARADDAPEPLVPTRYGRYVLLDHLGAGGMAEVFRALVVGPEQFQSVLVVKRILPHLCANQSFVKMFIDEARLCGLLSHPNIIRVQDFGQQDGQYFIAMEYLQGRNLTAIIRRALERREMVPPTVAAEIIRQACRGLAYAHALSAADGKPYGIIHRDVSPGNVMVTQSGAVKVLDFGVARVENRFRRALTDPGRVKGKAAYLAPEQMTGGSVDHRSDIFAVGILLHELLVGRRLFKGETSLESMKLVQTMPIRPPSSWHSQVPAALDAIVMRALERSPADRYQNAGEMADALEQFLLGAWVSSQELPAYMMRMFQQELENEKLTLSPEDLQAVMGRELSEKIITQLGGAGTAAEPARTPTTTTTPGPTAGGAARQGSGAAAAVLAEWPDLRSQDLEGEAAEKPRRRGMRLAVVVGTCGLLAVGALALQGGKSLGHAPMMAAAVVTASPAPAPKPIDKPATPPVAQENLAAEKARADDDSELAPAPPETAPHGQSATTTAATDPAQNTVQISINSSPGRALVWRAGASTPLGHTPLVVPVARGREAVIFRISKAGYVEGRLSVVPDIDQPALVTLAKTPSPTSIGNDQKVRNALPTDPFSD